MGKTAAKRQGFEPRPNHVIFSIFPLHPMNINWKTSCASNDNHPRVFSSNHPITLMLQMPNENVPCRKTNPCLLFGSRVCHKMVENWKPLRRKWYSVVIPSCLNTFILCFSYVCVCLCVCVWLCVCLCACVCVTRGPLNRYVKLRVAHASEMLGTFSPPPISKETANERSRHASRLVRDALAVMHAWIANPRCRGKRSRHSRRMRNPQFYVSGKRPMLHCQFPSSLSPATPKWVKWGNV